jgi:hypothetical protein
MISVDFEKQTEGTFADVEAKITLLRSKLTKAIVDSVDEANRYLNGQSAGAPQGLTQRTDPLVRQLRKARDDFAALLAACVLRSRPSDDQLALLLARIGFEDDGVPMRRNWTGYLGLAGFLLALAAAVSYLVATLAAPALARWWSIDETQLGQAIGGLPLALFNLVIAHAAVLVISSAIREGSMRRGEWRESAYFKMRTALQSGSIAGAGLILLALNQVDVKNQGFFPIVGVVLLPIIVCFLAAFFATLHFAKAGRARLNVSLIDATAAEHSGGPLSNALHISPRGFARLLPQAQRLSLSHGGAVFVVVLAVSCAQYYQSIYSGTVQYLSDIAESVPRLYRPQCAEASPPMQAAGKAEDRGPVGPCYPFTDEADKLDKYACPTPVPPPPVPLPQGSDFARHIGYVKCPNVERAILTLAATIRDYVGRFPPDYIDWKGGGEQHRRRAYASVMQLCRILDPTYTKDPTKIASTAAPDLEEGDHDSWSELRAEASDPTFNCNPDRISGSSPPLKGPSDNYLNQAAILMSAAHHARASLIELLPRKGAWPYAMSAVQRETLIVALISAISSFLLALAFGIGTYCGRSQEFDEFYGSLTTHSTAQLYKRLEKAGWVEEAGGGSRPDHQGDEGARRLNQRHAELLSKALCKPRPDLNEVTIQEALLSEGTYLRFLDALDNRSHAKAVSK